LSPLVGVFALAPLLLALACGGGDDGDGDGDEEQDVIITPTVLIQPTQIVQPTAVVEPTTEPAAPLEHTVAEGETLGTIAEQFGVTVEAIVAANEIENPDFIAVGDVLVIPAPEPEAAAPEATETPTP
jgi:LysM repeat protein